MNKKQKQPEYNEKGVRYMMCKCGEYISVGETATEVMCSNEVNRNVMMMFPELHEENKSTYKPTGRPPGWHFMNEFVDADGNVFHKGKEQPELKGTLKPTKVKPRKKKKKLTADEKLYKTIKEYKKRKKGKK